MSKISEEQEKELLSRIDSNSWSDLGHGYFNMTDEISDYLNEIFPGEVTIKCVDEWGGEGSGEDIGAVYHFPEIDLYIRIDGYYASHYGSDWDNAPYIVRPIDRVVTFYE